MGHEQVIDERVYLIERQFRGSVGIEHGSVIDMLFVARQYRFNHQPLHIDIAHLQCH